MPDIYLDVDTALAEVPVNLLPLLDDTDFKSREVAIAYNAAGMDLVWNFVTTGGAFTQTAVTPTTGGDYDWTHQGDGVYTIEIPAAGGASINNDTEGFGWFSGVATGVLPWRGPVIGFRAAGLNDALIDSAYSTTRGLAGTALPNAAADAAGGLVISDAGGLDADAQRSDVAAILVDTGTTLDARIPAALVSGRMDSSVGAMATNVLTAAAINADAITAAKLHSDVTTELQAGLATATALTTVEGKIDTIDGIVDAILVDTGTDLPASIDALPTAAENAVAVMTPAVSTWEDAADVRSMAVAAMKAVHKIAPSGATLQIFKTDNTTVKAEQALTTDAALEPVSAIGGTTAP